MSNAPRPYSQTGLAAQVVRTPAVHFAPDAGPPRLNVVVPNFYKEWAFGGIASAMSLAHELSRHYTRVRFVSDAPLGSADEMFDFAACVHDAGTTVEAASLRNGPLPCHAGDVFLCTWWKTVALWRAHVRAMEGAGLAPTGCYYFIQDFEPGFYPFGHEHSLCLDTYGHGPQTHAIFNSAELAGFFRGRGYAFVRETVLQPSLNPVLRQRLDRLDWRIPPKTTDGIIVLAYGRPRQPRNAFAPLVDGLHRYFRALPEAERRQYAVYSAGEAHEDLELAPGVVLASVGKLPIERYAEVLEQAHVGVSLMASPHPSYPPLEMAAFGMHTVTNNYEGKDLSGAHSLLRAIDLPDPVQVAEAMAWAVERARKCAGQPIRAVLPTCLHPDVWDANIVRADIGPILPSQPLA